jgi:hypothetical protein
MMLLLGGKRGEELFQQGIFCCPRNFYIWRRRDPPVFYRLRAASAPFDLTVTVPAWRSFPRVFPSSLPASGIPRLPLFSGKAAAEFEENGFFSFLFWPAEAELCMRSRDFRQKKERLRGKRVPLALRFLAVYGGRRRRTIGPPCALPSGQALAFPAGTPLGLCRKNTVKKSAGITDGFYYKTSQ